MKSSFTFSFFLDVFLKTTSSVIELMTDKEMFNMVEKSIRYDKAITWNIIQFYFIKSCYIKYRGGFVFVTEKFADVSEDPDSEIIYLDLNNM